MKIFDYLPKLKWGVGLTFDAHFLHDFSITFFPDHYSTNGKSSNVIPFFLLMISNKMCY